jgi:hypothetical protein
MSSGRAVGIGCVLAVGAALASGSTPRAAVAQARGAGMARPQLRIGDARCGYGGAVPGFSVLFDLDSNAPLARVTATAFRVQAQAQGGTFRDGAVGAVSVRRWSGPRGTGSIVPLGAPVPPGTVLHLQAFGRLDTSLFGPGAPYPTEARSFQLQLVADSSARLGIVGRCEVTPAG